MDLYFSGINDARTLEMAGRAGVTHILLNVCDLHLLASPRPHVIVDSPAYRKFKGKKVPDIPGYVELLAHAKALGHRFDFTITYDEFNDPKGSLRNWNHLFRQYGLQTVPVFHLHGDRSILKDYLMASEVVALGGLVPAMRERDMDSLHSVMDLCRANPNRFHFLGLNWLGALAWLMPYLRSADTSKWLDGRRYRHLIHRDEETGESLIQEFRPNEDGDLLSIANARNMQAFVKGESEPTAAELKPAAPALQPRQAQKRYTLKMNTKYRKG